MTVIDDIGPPLDDAQRKLLHQWFEEWCEREVFSKMLFAQLPWQPDDFVEKAMRMESASPPARAVAMEGP